MLTKDVATQIFDAVHKRPKTIQELSKIIGRSWVTTEKYVAKLSSEEGQVQMHTFRGGTRGALKIVYWVSDRQESSPLKTTFAEKIRLGKSKDDFPVSDLAHFAKNKKSWYIPEKHLFEEDNFDNFAAQLRRTNEELFLFSGNLSFSQMHNKDQSVVDVLEELAKRDVIIRILCRIELPGIDQIKNVLAINDRIGKKRVFIRHCYQPLRATLVDQTEVTLKETKNPHDFYEKELQEKINIIHAVYDEEWLAFLKQQFWALYRVSIDATDMIADIDTVREVNS